MAEFWESAFVKNGEMWGFEPCESAVAAADLFSEKRIKNVLIPGIGYGRNAEVFLAEGIRVSGIEISQTAIDLAKSHYGEVMTIHHGSVSDMPFDQQLYDGIFCYGLLYLLDEAARMKLINDCYAQLAINGLMVFSVLSTASPNFGRGDLLSKNRYQTPHGVNIFFYDTESIKQEFGQYGLLDFREIDEPVKNHPDKTAFRFWLIVCEAKTA